MKILALSGWGQPHDGLRNIAPGNTTHFDYTNHKNAEEAVQSIANTVKNHDAVIGWSLGGQLAVRAIASGVLKPGKLILIATPFQFVRSDKVNLGMACDHFDKFRENYAKNPKRTLNKAWELVAMHDKNATHVRSQLQTQDSSVMLEKNWLYWLDTLHDFTCQNLNFHDFPPTLLIHGKQDAVVEHAQSDEFAKYIPQVTHAVMNDAGHAPHWHDMKKVQTYIREHLNV